MKKIEVKGLHDKIDIRTKDQIKDEKVIVKIFNKRYINIVEKTSRIAPKNLGSPLDPKLDEKTICEIIENYRNHFSIKKKLIVDFPETTMEDINQITKSLNPNKATGPGSIPLNIIKTAANAIDFHLA